MSVGLYHQPHFTGQSKKVQVFWGRPLPVPKNSVNLFFVSQFAEISDDVVFTVDYSVRAAQMAVYQFMKINRPVPPITRHTKSLGMIFATLEKAFA